FFRLRRFLLLLLVRLRFLVRLGGFAFFFVLVLVAFLFLFRLVHVLVLLAALGGLALLAQCPPVQGASRPCHAHVSFEPRRAAVGCPRLSYRPPARPARRRRTHPAAPATAPQASSTWAGSGTGWKLVSTTELLL